MACFTAPCLPAGRNTGSGTVVRGEAVARYGPGRGGPTLKRLRSVDGHAARRGAGETESGHDHESRTDEESADRRWLGVSEDLLPLVRAGVVLGVGLGGFFDGIVLHQILQWHHMLTAHPDPAVAGDLPLNTLWDGLFHATTYLFTVAGVVLLLRAWRRPSVPASGLALLGATISGWGLFNLVEGTVDHHLLGIHHVWPAGPGDVLLWDLAFLAWGGAMLVLGYALIRRADAAGVPGGTA